MKKGLYSSLSYFAVGTNAVVDEILSFLFSFVDSSLGLVQITRI